MKKDVKQEMQELRKNVWDNWEELGKLKTKIRDAGEDGMPNCRTVSLSERLDKIEKKIKDAESKTDELFSLPGIQIMIKAEKIKQLIKARDAQSKDAREEIKKLKKEIEELGGKK